MRGGKRVLPRLDRPDVEEIAASGHRSRSERGIDTMRRDDDPVGRNAVEVDEVALRPLAHGDHASRDAGRPWDHPLEHEPVATAHRLRIALEREIVDRHDPLTRTPE